MVTKVCIHVKLLDICVVGVCRHFIILDIMLQVYADILSFWILCYRCMQICYMLDIMLQVYADMLHVGYYVTGVCRYVIC